MFALRQLLFPFPSSEIIINSVRFSGGRSNGKLEISAFTTFGGTAAGSERGLWLGSALVPAGHTASRPMKSILRFTTFEDFLNSKNRASGFYCLRFTFRDSRTGKRFEYYKVTSQVLHYPMPFEEGTASGGGFKRLFWNDIPSVLKEASKTMYADRAEEYVSNTN